MLEAAKTGAVSVSARMGRAVVSTSASVPDAVARTDSSAHVVSYGDISFQRSTVCGQSDHASCMSFTMSL